MNDLIISNVRMMPDGDVTSVSIKDGKFTNIGSLNLTALQSIDAHGCWILPAFVDSHVHLFSGGVALSRLNLGHVSDIETLTKEVHAFQKGRENSPLLCGYAANYTILGEGTRPDRHILDMISPVQPLMIVATDLHAGWANTAALRDAGLMDKVPDLTGALVVLGSDGLPNGELQENGAMDLVYCLSESGGRENLGIGGHEPASVTDYERALDKATLARALSECVQNGITAAVNMDGNLYQAELLSEMAREGDLPIRVSLPMTITPQQDDKRIAALMDRASQAPIGMLSFGRIKMFMDGVYDTWTALRTDDYPDKLGFRSEPLFTASAFADICTNAHARELQIATHCVGDGAVRATVEGYEVAMKNAPSQDIRHRIEHLDVAHPNDIQRMAQLGITASMQPVHPPGLSGLPLEPTVSIIGSARWPDAFAWASIAKAGVPIAFGTDWPVSPLSPLNAVHAALSRRPWAQEDPDQRLSIDAVLTAYSLTGAQLELPNCRFGALLEGYDADLILLDNSPSMLSQSKDSCSLKLVMCKGETLLDTLG